jgi:hypothetical protein
LTPGTAYHSGEEPKLSNKTDSLGFSFFERSPVFFSEPKPNLTMDQKLEGTPKATLQLNGRAVTRTEVTNDWGTRLQWQIKRDGKEIATTTAGLDLTYEHPETAPGKYEVVLQQFYYVSYKKDTSGKFTESKYVNISDAVSYTI